MVKIKKLFINKIFSNIIMVDNKSPICELKDNLDMAISKFIIDTKLQELLPKELRSFLPKNFEAEEESTVSKMVKFRTKQSQLISVKKTAKAASTISKEDALNKAKQKASIIANDALDQEIKLLQRSIDLGNLDDTECGLDSSTLEESIEQIDENNYKITKDLILIDLDLIIKKDQVLTIPKGINLTNKKHIKNFGKIINYGNISNLNGISNFLENKGGQFMSYKGSSYRGKVQEVIPQSVSSVSWPEGTSLFFTTNPDTVTISNISNSYTISQNSSSSSTISLNFYAVPPGITGFYLTNIQTTGGGGGGGGGIINTAGGFLYATIANVGNGGCGGANIITQTLNYYNESNPLPIVDGLTINFTTGSGGNGGTCPKSIPNWGTYSSVPSNGAGSPGGPSSLSISTTTYPNFFSQQAGGGDGGYVLNILAQENEQNTFNSSSSSNYPALANPTSSSSQYYDTTTGDIIPTPIIVNGFSGGIGGMSYNTNPSYNQIPDSTNGQAPSGGFLGAGGGSGVGQGAYSASAGGQSGNPYSGNQSGGGGGGITSNVGGLGYQYYTYPSTPSQPSPSIGGGGGGAGVLWMDSGSNSGQNGGNGYNSITVTFVTI